MKSLLVRNFTAGACERLADVGAQAGDGDGVDVSGAEDADALGRSLARGEKTSPSWLPLDSPAVWLSPLFGIGSGGREFRELRPRNVLRKLSYLEGGIRMHCIRNYPTACHRAPLTFVTRVRFPHSASHVG